MRSLLGAPRVVDADRLEALHRPRANTRHSTPKQRTNARMPIKLLQTLYHGLAETERRQGCILVHKVVPELPDNVGLGAREDLNFQGRSFRA